MLTSRAMAYSNDFVHYQAIAGQKQNQPNCQATKLPLRDAQLFSCSLGSNLSSFGVDHHLQFGLFFHH
jgi:hypothetical protein